ncbi:HAMP domain-containing protein [Pseudomaricurvus alkylphenolicus]|uniref:methyl-accepting chemotaxis protein n=1 Tax=Pseudomaricurvus alkylphenolicus TaxID=1306991 RepID=UPI001422B042|nr:methyl-accepting chemotaxis protein [Pseudomaricurvus alkylphenolicus]NIB38207.1 HAMP domain-containing protein [Pseudomaricurvus alkylphenolicus]
MKIRTKLTLGALLLALVPVAVGCFVVGLGAIESGRNTLEQQAQRQLVSIRDTTAANITSYFDTIRNQVLTLSNNRMIMDAAREFSQAYRELPLSDTETKREQLENYYIQNFARQYREQNGGNRPPVQSMLDQLEPRALELQYQYIQANPHPLGEKHLLAAAEDGSDYSRAHQRFHPHIRDFLERFGYYDIFIVEPHSGNIVYSVFKEVDYATSLISGSFANSTLGEAFRRANRADRDSVVLTDFSPYTPSYESPASFIASPVYDGDEKVAVLIFQMPIDRINAVMTHQGNWMKTGLGASGETYLVGQDMTMRSQSRFLQEDPDGYLRTMEEVGLSTAQVNELAAKGTSIGLQRVDTEGTRAALSGDEGFARFRDYRGVEVMSAYKLLRIEGLNWAIMSEIDAEEALLPVVDLRNDIISKGLFSGLITLFAAGVAGWLFSRQIVKPINQTVAMVKDIAEGEGDLTQRLDASGKDELSEMAHWFNVFVGKLLNMVSELNDSVAHLASSSEQFSAVSRETKQDIENQHQQTQQVATALTQMSVSVDEVARGASNAAEAARKAHANTGEGQVVIEDCRNAIEVIATEIESASTVIEELHAESEKIGSVLEVIESIAEQTNLLALNAAIEAARAGDSGRGFAVVADEVRGLAQRTQDSTHQIHAIIEQLQTSAKSAVSVISNSRVGSRSSVDKAMMAKAAFDQIVSSINAINDMSAQIASAAEQQSATTSEISNNVVAISSVSAKTNDNAEMIAGGSTELSVLANQLRQMLGGYKTS